jgi:hypothetical protein
MTDSGGLESSLAAMGFLELALAFFALACYAIVLNGSLGGAARGTAALVAALSGGGFVAITEPWTNGVIFLVTGVGGIGLFVAAVWLVSAACGLNRQPQADAAAAVADGTADGAAQGAATAAVRARPPTVIHTA